MDFSRAAARRENNRPLGLVYNECHSARNSLPRWRKLPMRKLFARLSIGLIASAVLAPMAMGQAGAGLGNSLYNKLKDMGPGGPAPKRSLTGVWTGPLESMRGEAPAMTALGQKLFSMHKTEGKDGWADSNDPWKTCDPLGFPRSAVNEIRGISFAEMPNKIVVMHQYNRIWREVWMD